jgi:hypothetical protein
MMDERRVMQEALFYGFSLERHVPNDHLLRKKLALGPPVIDEQRATLYLDAAIVRANGPRHEIFALSLTDGSTQPGWPPDVAAALGASFDPSVQNQRGALALFKGKVFVPFSGHWGDCGDYHGFVVGISIDDPSEVSSFSTRATGDREPVEETGFALAQDAEIAAAAVGMGTRFLDQRFQRRLRQL